MVSGSSIQEFSQDQNKWLDGQIDTIQLNINNQVGPGATVYWHTSDSTRRWNHKGNIELADANHPNHS